MLQYGFLCLLILRSVLNAQNEIAAQVVALLDRKAYVEYKLIEWNYEGFFFFVISTIIDINSLLFNRFHKSVKRKN